MSDNSDNEKRLREYIEGSVNAIAARLVIELGLEEAKAREIARDATNDVTNLYGARYMYVPKNLEYTLSKRDMEIYQSFNGRNIHQLVDKHKVTHTRIYQIVAQVGKEEIRKRQAALPGI